LESRKVAETPEDKSTVVTPLPSANEVDKDYFGGTAKTAKRMAETIRVEMFQGEKDGRNQDPEEFLDDVEFLAEQWSGDNATDDMQ
jgi:hypothetical protein